MLRNFMGAVKLPHSIYVGSDTLGHSYGGAVESGSFVLMLPKLPKELGTGLKQLECPVSHGDILAEGYSWGSMSHMIVAGETPNLASNVERVAVSLECASELDRAHLAHIFGREFTSWYTRASQWVELWASQVLTPYQGEGMVTEGQMWETNASLPNRTGWRSKGFTFYVPGRAADRSMLEAAFQNVTSGITLPLEWRIYLSATRTYDNRIAVIEAVSAVEIALSKALAARLPNLPKGAENRIAQNANGIVGVIRLIEDIEEIPNGEQRWRRVANRLAEPRNQAAHRGVAPSQDVVNGVLQEARGLLDRYSPLPSPSA